MVPGLAGCLDNSGRAMKGNKSPRRSGRVNRSDRVSGNEEACLEIQSFLKALDSYPERFARNPGVSFEQYHSGLMSGRNGSSRAKQDDCEARRN